MILSRVSAASVGRMWGQVGWQKTGIRIISKFNLGKVAFTQSQAADWRKVSGGHRLSHQVKSPICCLWVGVDYNLVTPYLFIKCWVSPTEPVLVFDCSYQHHLIRSHCNCLIRWMQAVCRALTDTQRLLCSECPSPDRLYSLYSAMQPPSHGMSHQTWEKDAAGT